MTSQWLRAGLGYLNRGATAAAVTGCDRCVGRAVAPVGRRLSASATEMDIRERYKPPIMEDVVPTNPADPLPRKPPASYDTNHVSLLEPYGISSSSSSSSRSSASSPASASALRSSALVHSSLLANGLRLGSSNVVGQASAVGVLLDAGSCYETPATDAGLKRGVAQLAERLFLKRAHDERTKLLYDQMLDSGGYVATSQTRDSLCFVMEVLRDGVPAAVELLAQLLTRPVFTQADLDEARAVLGQEAIEFLNQPSAVLAELVHSVAFAGQPLGVPQQAEPDQLAAVTVDDLHRFAEQFVTGPRVVLAAAGIDHDTLENAAMEHWAGLTADSPVAPAPRSSYQGGFRAIRGPADTPMAHMALAFESCSATSDDIFPVAVLQTLLGGGDSFSSGGPGKGMYSRLYRRVLNHQSVETAVAFNHVYRDAGVLGVFASVPPSHLQFIVELLAHELQDVVQNLDAVEFDRAKNQTKSAVLMNLESRAVLFEDIARQLLAQGRHVSAAELVDQVDRLTRDQFVEFTRRTLLSPPTFVAFGPPPALDGLPTDQHIHQYFQKKLTR